MKKLLFAVFAIGISSAAGLFVSSQSVSAGVGCVEGDRRQDFTVVWNQDRRSGVVKTKEGKTLCKDVPLIVSSYTLPENYNGKGWWDSANNRVNPTMIPQPLFQSKRFTMLKGSMGDIAFTVPVNPACGRWVQVDPYIGSQEITTIIGKGGIEDKIISGAVSKNDACTPPPPPCPAGTAKDASGKCVAPPKPCADGSQPDPEGSCPAPEPEQKCVDGTAPDADGKCPVPKEPEVLPLIDDTTPIVPANPQVLPSTGPLTYVGTVLLVGVAIAVGFFVWRNLGDKRLVAAGKANSQRLTPARKRPAATPKRK